ncbi:MAG: TrkH family potassium uptake protein [Lachnospiraceae bacterium]|nr:TrkH family potassium uptake protein [Lachnospiraceae bacterium]
MNLSMIIYLLGCLMEIEAGLMLFPALIGLVYSESSAVYFLIVAAMEAIPGLILILRKPKNTTFFAREGFVVTALSWLLLSAIGALPFYLTRQIPSYLDALFETVSGFTTTGASILLNVEALDKCMLFWRSFSHWIGGMGVLVFMMAILPLAGAGGQKLYLLRAESPGPSVDKLVPKIRDTAIWLYGIYIFLTFLCFVLLLSGGMDAFTAICMSFGAAGTGGFGVLGSSFAEYSQFCKVVCTIFMMLFGLNFNFYYLILLRKFKDALSMEEVKWYLLVYFFAVGTILINLSRTGILFRNADTIDAFFSVASVMTTTGYATSDFNLWPTYSRTILVVIMFSGACAGSTGGGIKISRFIICIKSVGKELKRMIQPRTVKRVQLDKQSVEHATVMNTLAYIVIYLMIYLVSLLIVATDGFDTTTTFTSVAATFNNIGPGLELVGPIGNYAGFSWLSKLVLIFDMLAGRLEIYPMIFLMLPSTWKRSFFSGKK